MDLVITDSCGPAAGELMSIQNGHSTSLSARIWANCFKLAEIGFVQRLAELRVCNQVIRMSRNGLQRATSLPKRSRAIFANQRDFRSSKHHVSLREKIKVEVGAHNSHLSVLR